MSVGWVSGAVRARSMERRRIGRAAARRLAAAPTLDLALATLAGGPYRQGVRMGQSLAEAQRGVVETVLWNIRVLAGWVPRGGVVMLRVLLGSIEAANVADHLLRIAGTTTTPDPYRLGALGTAWSRLSAARTAGEVRRTLAASVWGDPGGETPRAIGLAMRTGLADRVIAAVPPAGAWSEASIALLVARQQMQKETLPNRARVNAARVLGARALDATSLPDLVDALPLAARWALEGVAGPDDLWLAEARWWARVEEDALGYLRHAAPGPEPVVAAVALLAVDAWRVRGALELAARGGAPLEVFDAVA